MRVAADAREWVKGRRTGIGRYLEGIVTRALERDPDWEWVLYLGEECEERVRGTGVTYHRLPARATWAVDQLEIPRRIRSDRPDVFFSPYPKAPWRCAARTVLTIHDLHQLILPPHLGGHTALRRAAYRAHIRINARRAASVVTVSDSTAGQIESLLGVPADRIRNFHQRVDDRFFGPARDAAGPGSPLLVVSNFLPHKNVETVFRAIALVRAQHPGIRLKLVGDGPGREPLARAAEGLGIARNVEWAGVLGDDSLAVCYREAAALLQPSFEEGFGLPVAEAMAGGTPVVVSSGGSLPEVVGDAGAIIAPEDVEGWAGGIGRLLEDPREWSDRSSRARRRAEAFRAENTTDRLLDFLARFAEVSD